jgi:hypothetical protein
MLDAAGRNFRESSTGCRIVFATAALALEDGDGRWSVDRERV